MATQVIADIAAIIAKQAALKIVEGVTGGGLISGLGSILGFADGGRVTHPTMALIGEGNEPFEDVVPASKQRAYAKSVLGGSGQSVTVNMGGVNISIGSGVDSSGIKAVIDTLVEQLRSETIDGVRFALASANAASRNSMRAV
jgi:hypothetical protein